MAARRLVLEAVFVLLTVTCIDSEREEQPGIGLTAADMAIRESTLGAHLLADDLAHVLAHRGALRDRLLRKHAPRVHPAARELERYLAPGLQRSSNAEPVLRPLSLWARTAAGTLQRARTYPGGRPCVCSSRSRRLGAAFARCGLRCLRAQETFRMLDPSWSRLDAARTVA